MRRMLAKMMQEPLPEAWPNMNESKRATGERLKSVCFLVVGTRNSGEWTATNLLDIEPWMFLDCQSSNGWSAEVSYRRRQLVASET